MELVDAVYTLIFLLMSASLIIFFISLQQSPSAVKDLCKSCGYNKTTDKTYLTPFSPIPIVSKIECDKKVILDVAYPYKEDKWGSNNEFDWNKPYVRSCNG